jgi:DinB family protein
MNRRQLETLLVTLESTPALLERASSGLSSAQVSRRPAGGGFSLLENVWHLADLEKEGFGTRIRRLLSEDEPTFANFDGERIARERRYQDRDLSEGLAAFASARRRNIEKLRGVARGDWKRRGTQDQVGKITLSDIPRKMAEHDRSHTQEIAALLSELRGEPVAERLDHPTSAVA